jgi:hypothetical protein
MIKRINAPVMRAATPSSEAPLAAVTMASPIPSGPLHLENPRVVGISPASPATLRTPQASSAAAWWSRVLTVQIGPRHEVAPVTMVASQTAQKSPTGSNAQSAHRSRRGTGTRSRLHRWLLATNAWRSSLVDDGQSTFRRWEFFGSLSFRSRRRAGASSRGCLRRDPLFIRRLRWMRPRMGHESLGIGNTAGDLTLAGDLGAG